MTTTQTQRTAVTQEANPPGLSEDDLERTGRGWLLATGDKIEPHVYPRLYNLSAGFGFRRVVRADVPDHPEFVTAPFGELDPRAVDRLAVVGSVAMWNLQWEAAQFRRRAFNEDELPDWMVAVADQGDFNIVFVPRTRSRYYEYSPLFHLLPRSIVERFGLPLLLGGQWPFVANAGDVDRYLPEDFERRLAQAWASVVWRHLMPGSPASAFSNNDPIRLLAHNLAFWVPPVTQVITNILSDFPLVPGRVKEGPVRLTDGSLLPGATAGSPRTGGDLWRGEDEAAEVLADVVEAADGTGRLRSILDAVRSNRVEDDFSDRWSYAREDFERKLYRKRAKVKVRFVELTDTIPVQGPEAEVDGRIVYSDFLALLDERDRQIVVLLHSGMTKLTNIAHELGYANHSAVSKRLTQIRRQAERHFRDV